MSAESVSSSEAASAARRLNGLETSQNVLASFAERGEGDDGDEAEASGDEAAAHVSTDVVRASESSTPEVAAGEVEALVASHRPCSCGTWSRRRTRLAALGCCSSALVLTVRLVLDFSPTAYIIHSFVVFLDMTLIHLFTSSRWLSGCGELVTYGSVLAFALTKHKVFEYVETVLIAGLCSMHLIRSRNKHHDHERELEREVRRLSTRLSSINLVCAPAPEASLLARETEKAQNRSWWDNFYEHYLDGSAGVMYTSFLGLILDALLQ